MLKQSKGEIWIGLVGLPFPMRAEKITHEKDGRVTFLRLVEGKDHSKRTDHHARGAIIYISETIATQ